MLSLWSLFKAGLLVVNACAVLHPERFLRSCECPTPRAGRGGRRRRGTHARRGAQSRICNSAAATASLSSAAAAAAAAAAPAADGLERIDGTTGLRHQVASLLHATRFMRSESAGAAAAGARFSSARLLGARDAARACCRRAARCCGSGRATLPSAVSLRPLLANHPIGRHPATPAVPLVVCNALVIVLELLVG